MKKKIKKMNRGLVSEIKNGNISGIILLCHLKFYNKVFR